jgi:hypothetical protein
MNNTVCDIGLDRIRTLRNNQQRCDECYMELSKHRKTSKPKPEPVLPPPPPNKPPPSAKRPVKPVSDPSSSDDDTGSGSESDISSSDSDDEQLVKREEDNSDSASTRGRRKRNNSKKKQVRYASSDSDVETQSKKKRIASFKMPTDVATAFCIFRDKNNSTMNDPVLFLRKLNRKMKFVGVPPDRYVDVPWKTMTTP